jgi:threonine/homoserine/homoserine lactone efflux protein
MRMMFSRVGKWVDRASGIVFIVLAIKLATEKSG